MVADHPDLFAQPPPAAPPVAPPAPAPAAVPRPGDPADLFIRPPAWTRLLARAYSRDITLCVSTVWTGVIVETLSCPDVGRWFLYNDGSITEVARDTCYGRVIYASPTLALRLHATWPLMRIDAGAAGGRFRFATAAELADTGAHAAIPAMLAGFRPSLAR